MRNLLQSLTIVFLIVSLMFSQQTIRSLQRQLQSQRNAHAALEKQWEDVNGKNQQTIAEYRGSLDKLKNSFAGCQGSLDRITNSLDASLDRITNSLDATLDLVHGSGRHDKFFITGFAHTATANDCTIPPRVAYGGNRIDALIHCCEDGGLTVWTEKEYADMRERTGKQFDDGCKATHATEVSH